MSRLDLLILAARLVAAIRYLSSNGNHAMVLTDRVLAILAFLDSGYTTRNASVVAFCNALIGQDVRG